MFTQLGIELIWPVKDRVTIEIPIYMKDYQLSDGTVTSDIPIELFICKKKEMKNVFNAFPYLKAFVAPTLVRNFKQDNSDNNSLMILAETEEAANHIIDS